VLFVPPFWPHHVHYDTEGMSLSVFSPSHQTKVLDDLQTIALPFEAAWSLPTLVLKERSLSTACCICTELQTLTFCTAAGTCAGVAG
jgi:hypothetical protein